MSAPSPHASPLESLKSSNELGLLDAIDSLRSQGVSHYVSLPQLIVCGDQSSGKSSIFKVITKIPFPQKENLCTWFATEIIIKRSIKSSILCKINPDDGCLEDKQCKFCTFSKFIKDFSKFPFFINKVTAIMGLSLHKAFLKNILSIEICGLECLQL